MSPQRQKPVCLCARACVCSRGGQVTFIHHSKGHQQQQQCLLQLAGSLLSATHLCSTLTPFIAVLPNSRQRSVAPLTVGTPFWEKRFFCAGCGEFFCACDKSRTGPQEPSHSNSPCRACTMDSPKIESNSTKNGFATHDFLWIWKVGHFICR